MQHLGRNTGDAAPKWRKSVARPGLLWPLSGGAGRSKAHICGLKIRDCQCVRGFSGNSCRPLFSRPSWLAARQDQPCRARHRSQCEGGKWQAAVVFRYVPDRADSARGRAFSGKGNAGYHHHQDKRAPALLVMDDGKALRYGIGVGRDGFRWSGVETVSMKTGMAGLDTAGADAQAAAGSPPTHGRRAGKSAGRPRDVSRFHAFTASTARTRNRPSAEPILRAASA